jgi:hypothetical protein
MIKENIVLRLNVEKTYSVGLKNQEYTTKKKCYLQQLEKTYLPGH